jgi:RNA polymerase sigma factor (TIGR02999 family)
MSEDVTREVTRVLQEQHDPAKAREELLPLVYEQLRAIAQRRMSEERADHTLQATALVHEAFLRLVGDRNLSWDRRSSFYAAASEAMRRILVDHARKRGSLKRGAARAHVPLSVVDLAAESDPDTILALEEAMTRLETEDPRAARVVQLRFYAGLSVEETAKALELSERTVMREWSFAKARLFEMLHPEGGTDDDASG